MKKIVASFIAGVIVTLLMIGSVAYATGNNELIEVILNSINVAVNGELVSHLIMEILIIIKFI